MFKINDYVAYGLTGVCQITDIKQGEFNGSQTEYYVLHPVFNDNMTIKIPINSVNDLIRPVITREEASSLIETMPKIETISVDNKRERDIAIKTALRTGQVSELVKVVKTLYLDRQAKGAANKKISKTDEDLMAAAEKQLNEEIAVALNISPAEVVPYILEHIQD